MKTLLYSALAGVALCAAAAPHAGAQVVARPLDDRGVDLDGVTEDWPPAVYLGGDEEHVYLRFKTRHPITLLAAPSPVVVEIDLDGNEQTGRTLGGLGVDLELHFSEEVSSGGYRGPTIGVVGIRPDGSRVKLSAEQIGLVIAPSHASEWFELRFDRSGKISDVVKAGSFVKGGPVEARVVIGGQKPAQPDADLIPGVLPQAKISASKADVSIPAKPKDALRVMSWNVLWGGPEEKPESYGKVIKAISPDVIFFQEWTRDTPSEETITKWLDTNTGSTGWHVEASEGWGVVVASRYPMLGRASQSLTTGGVGNDYPIRFTAAAFDTPLGVGVFGTLHHKCCGGLGSSEDVRRLTEAAVLNNAMEDLIAEAGGELVVIGGDYNLVGSLGVLTVGTSELDLDGTGLRVADPKNLADDRLMYTYGRPGDANLRSRLDYLSYSDSTVRPVNAFILETGLLSDASLKKAGLTAEDGYASDHLPVVVDLKKTK